MIRTDASSLLIMNILRETAEHINANAKQRCRPNCKRCRRIEATSEILEEMKRAEYVVCMNRGSGEGYQTPPDLGVWICSIN